MPSPTQNIASALTAYAKASRTGLVEKQGGDEPSVGGFADLLKNALVGAKETAIHGELKSMDAVTDRADLNQVVTAVAEAELTLQTVVSIRDKVIDAYQEILRMPI